MNKRLRIFVSNLLVMLNNDFSKQVIVKSYKINFFFLDSYFKTKIS